MSAAAPNKITYYRNKDLSLRTTEICADDYKNLATDFITLRKTLGGFLIQEGLTSREHIKDLIAHIEGYSKQQIPVKITNSYDCIVIEPFLKIGYGRVTSTVN